MPPLGIRKAGVALPAAAPALRLRMAVARRGGRLAAGGTARAPRRRTVPVAPLAKIVSDESFEEKGTVSEGQAGPTGTDDLLEKSATLEVPRRKR